LINKARLLQLWPTHLLVLVHAHEGNAAAGLDMCRVNLNIAAAIGDEPLLVCQLYRSRHVGTAVSGLERLLGQAKLTGADLAAFQERLWAEASFDPWPIGLRGDRADMHLVLDAVTQGLRPVSRLPRKGDNADVLPSWPEKARDWMTDRFPANVDECHLWWLRRTTRLLRETVPAPWHERARAVAAFAADDTTPQRFDFGRSITMLFPRLQYGRARLLCAITAIAAERYRMAHGGWPPSLDAVVPEFLPAVPTDPFDGQILNYKRLADGFVVYSVGPDLTDNSGNLARDELPLDGTDVGFRLWDVRHRGQAANGAVP
jgi:hypothetical protein